MDTGWVFKDGKDINFLSFQQIEGNQPSVYIQIILSGDFNYYCSFLASFQRNI